LEVLNADRYIVEVIGYIARCVAHNETGKLMPYVIQNAFILLAPAMFAASIYMTLGRTIRSVKGENYSVIRVNWLTKTFVLGDVLSFMVQGSAAGLMVTGSNVRLGENIVVVGLFIQIIMFGLFAVTTVLFHVRFQQCSLSEVHSEQIPWKQSLNMLYAVSALIMVRSIFRVAEYVTGQGGYPLTHEWTLYMFDSLLMFIVMFIFFVWYPSRIRPTALNVANVELTRHQKQ
jgi:hypothetical protein